MPHGQKGTASGHLPPVEWLFCAAALQEPEMEHSDSHEAAYDEQNWRTLTLFFIPNTTYPLT
jgi:hypothetical protein